MVVTQVCARAEARADAPVHVYVSPEEVALDVAVLGALLRVELGAPVLVLPPERAGAPVRTVHISREGNAGSAGRLHIRVDPGGEATIEIGALPLEARPRALALAIAELSARSVTSEREAATAADALVAAPAPVAEAPAPAGPQSPAREAPDGAAMRARPFGEVGLGLRAFPSYSTFATDLRGALTVGWVRLDLGGTVFQNTDPLGRVTVAAPSAGVGVAMQGRAGGVNLSIGPRIEGGVIFATSEASNPDAKASSARALLLTAGIGASAAIPLEGPHRAVVSLQLGHVVAGADVRAGDRRSGGIGGPLLGLHVGYGR